MHNIHAINAKSDETWFHVPNSFPLLIIQKERMVQRGTNTYKMNGWEVILEPTLAKLCHVVCEKSLDSMCDWSPSLNMYPRT